MQGQKPDATIKLPLGTPGELTFDAQDNLFVQDHTWGKVWMFNYIKDPSWLVPVNGSSCVPAGLPGDANGDRAVNVLDYALLTLHFATGTSVADFNKDGQTNILDYAVLTMNFGRTL